MGLFATPAGARRGALTTGDPSQEMPECLPADVPARFEAVGEALVTGSRTHAACAVVGRELARDGIDLGEALDGLRSTFARVLGREPDFGSTQALSVAWSDETLGYLHQVSCEDPLTGLATLGLSGEKMTSCAASVRLRSASICWSGICGAAVPMPPVASNN